MFSVYSAARNFDGILSQRKNVQPCDGHLEFFFGQNFLAPVSLPHGEYKTGPNSKSIKKSVRHGKGSLTHLLRGSFPWPTLRTGGGETNVFQFFLSFDPTTPWPGKAVGISRRYCRVGYSRRSIPTAEPQSGTPGGILRRQSVPIVGYIRRRRPPSGRPLFGCRHISTAVRDGLRTPSTPMQGSTLKFSNFLQKKAGKLVIQWQLLQYCKIAEQKWC